MKWGIIIIMGLILGGLLTLFIMGSKMPYSFNQNLNPSYFSFFENASFFLSKEEYNGNYRVMLKTGNESIWKENFKINPNGKVSLCFETTDEMKGDVHIKKDISFYKSRNLIKQENIEIKYDEEKYEFCYEANSSIDFYLKFGDNSIIVIQESEVISTSLLDKIYAEANFTHLNLSETHPFDEDLIVYYPFDGDVSNETGIEIHDWSNSSYDETLVNDAQINDSGNCYLGKCLSLDGDNDYVQLADADLNGNQSTTWLMWIRPTSVDDTDALLWYPDECVLRLKTSNNGVEMILNTFASNDRVTVNSGWIADEWTHTGGFYNGTDLCAYGNGAFNCVQPTGGYNPCYYLDLGIRAQSSNDYEGLIDEVMIFDDALTEAEILEIYRNQSSRFSSDGNQKVRAVNITDPSTWNNDGYNQINLTTTFNNYAQSNISVRLGQINSSVDVEGLKLYMPFEWGTAVDISGNEKDGTFKKYSRIASNGLNDTLALRLNGTSYLDLNDVNSVYEITVSAWVYLTKNGSAQYIVSKMNPSEGNYAWGLYFNADNTLAFLVSETGENGNWSYTYSTGTPANNTFEWIHTLARFNTTDVDLFVNGEEDSGEQVGRTVDQIYQNSSVNTLIGAYATSLTTADAYLNGRVDNVMIWNRSLSDAEISTLYTSQSGKLEEAYYTDYYNITYDEVTNFTISTEADFIFPQYELFADNSTNPFFSSILRNMTIETDNIVEPPPIILYIAVSKIYPNIIKKPYIQLNNSLNFSKMPYIKSGEDLDFT